MDLMSARGAQKTRSESKKLEMYSKQWSPGDTLRVFYPIFWQDGTPEIAVGAIWGHNVSDIKELGLGTAFIPSTTEFDSSEGRPIGQPDITYQFSLIAPIFVRGQKAIEEAAILKKNWPTDAARKEALTDLEKKFDTKNNQKAVKPIIGRAQYYISTEAVVIKYVNDTPKIDTIKVVSVPMNDKLIRSLYTIIDDPKYGPQDGDEFVEVEWKYPVDPDKTKSAQAATPNGLTTEYRMSVHDPAAYDAVKGYFSQVCREAKTIVRRATRSVAIEKITQAIQQYTFLKSEYLDAANEEDIELLTKYVNVMERLDAIRALTNDKVIDELNKALAVASENVSQGDVPIPDIPETQTPPDPAMAGNTNIGQQNLQENVEKAEQEIANAAAQPATGTTSATVEQDDATNGSPMDYLARAAVNAGMAPTLDSIAGNLLDDNMLSNIDLSGV